MNWCNWGNKSVLHWFTLKKSSLQLQLALQHLKTVLREVA